MLASGQAADGTFVPDHVASGTTVLMCAQGHTVLTQYGPSSAAKHRALGLRCLDDAPARARHDVDTVEDLQMATALGLGRETAAVQASMHGPGALDQHVS